MAREKIKPSDGLGPYEIKRIRVAVRLVWSRSLARRLAVKRCTNEEGFEFCELCKKQTPRVKIDHIVAVGDVDDGFIPRMFCSSNKLMGLCSKCHNEKTKEERRLAKEKK